MIRQIALLTLLTTSILANTVSISYLNLNDLSSNLKTNHFKNYINDKSKDILIFNDIGNQNYINSLSIPYTGFISGTLSGNKDKNGLYVAYEKNKELKPKSFYFYDEKNIFNGLLINGYIINNFAVILVNFKYVNDNDPENINKYNQKLNFVIDYVYKNFTYDKKKIILIGDFYKNTNVMKDIKGFKPLLSDGTKLIKSELRDGFTIERKTTENVFIFSENSNTIKAEVDYSIKGKLNDSQFFNGISEFYPIKITIDQNLFN